MAPISPKFTAWDKYIYFSGQSRLSFAVVFLIQWPFLSDLNLIRLRQNYELQKLRLRDAKSELAQFEGQLDNRKEENRTLDRRMNSIKPKILQLQRSKQQYIMWV